MSVYPFRAKLINGEEISLEQFKGKVLLIVNTASKCGFTPQYEDLQKLYEKYHEKGLEILGFPCNQFDEQEPGGNSDVQTFCQKNYGVTFPLFEKINVRDEGIHPLFEYLTEQAHYRGIDTSNASGKLIKTFLEENHPEFLIDDSIKWNFTKFLIDRNGNVVKRFEPSVEPFDMDSEIEELL
ncbi:MAG TPA: glutathione peroxidase [Massilibacterium sp.]|nr:glutathione peroxidase [Massilibacterium sp.]